MEYRSIYLMLPMLLISPYMQGAAFALQDVASIQEARQKFDAFVMAQDRQDRARNTVKAMNIPAHRQELADACQEHKNTRETLLPVVLSLNNELCTKTAQATNLRNELKDHETALALDDSFYNHTNGLLNWAIKHIYNSTKDAEKTAINTIEQDATKWYPELSDLPLPLRDYMHRARTQYNASWWSSTYTIPEKITQLDHSAAQQEATGIKLSFASGQDTDKLSAQFSKEEEETDELYFQIVEELATNAINFFNQRFDDKERPMLKAAPGNLEITNQEIADLRQYTSLFLARLTEAARREGKTVKQAITELLDLNAAHALEADVQKEIDSETQE